MNKNLPLTKKFLPNADYMILSWRDLEAALRLTADPTRYMEIAETVGALQVLNRDVGPEKAILTMVAAIAFLTSDGDSSNQSSSV
jgi:hypothetical protein